MSLLSHISSQISENQTSVFMTCLIHPKGMGRNKGGNQGLNGHPSHFEFH
jgi:hypothetical protein